MIFFKKESELTQEEFREYFKQYYKQIKNYLYYKSGDMNLPEDIVQEAFIILWKNRNNVKRETISAYLYKISENIFLNELKHLKIVRNFELTSDISETDSESPEFIIEQEEFRKKLNSALESLPEKSRVVFLMNRIDGLKYKEIALRLEISQKAVEKRMNIALSELKKLSDKI